MGPKVEAAVRFVEQGGARSAIGDLDAAVAVLAESPARASSGLTSDPRCDCGSSSTTSVGSGNGFSASMRLVGHVRPDLLLL